MASAPQLAAPVRAGAAVINSKLAERPGQEVDNAEQKAV